MAPAASASRTWSCITAISASFAGRERSAMPTARSVVWPTSAAQLIAAGRASSAARYAANEPKRSPPGSATRLIGGTAVASPSGARLMPQLPTITVVTPWLTLGAMSGAASSRRSSCVCTSMNPGATTSPRASTTRAAGSAPSAPTAVMRPPLTATSAARRGPPVPSMTVPPRSRRSTGGIGVPIKRGGHRALAALPPGREACILSCIAGRGTQIGPVNRLRQGDTGAQSRHSTLGECKDGPVIHAVSFAGFEGDVVVAARRRLPARRRRRAGAAEDAEIRARGRPAQPRSDLDHRVHHAQPRLHGLRRAVRRRREVRGAAADGRQARAVRRQAHLHVHAARRPQVPRRPAGQVGRLHRVDPALGQARRVRAEAGRHDRQLDRRQRQDLPPEAEAAVPLRARCAGEAVVERPVHHAGARRQDRRLHRDYRGRSAPAPSALSRKSGCPATRSST